MRRREFLGVLGGGAAWPLAAHAQQDQRIRRIGVLIGGPNDAIFQAKFAVFQQSLQRLGWAEGRNIEFNMRWGGHDAERLETESRELARVKPDVIFVGPSNALNALRSQTRSIPIVFVQVSDPVGQGIVNSLARPSGNITGFSNYEFSIVGKWMQTLKEIAPGVTRVALMIHTGNAVSAKWFQQFQSLAPPLSVKPIEAPVRERTDIQKVFENLARTPNGGIIIPGDTFTDTPRIREFIVGLATHHRIPSLSAQRGYVANGALISYGMDQVEQFRLAATYVDRILRGESPADLPVQQPTKFDFMINLKTAKALGLTIPPTLLARADEVIE